ncbi:zinc ribbon domain-containing protein [Streptomyces alkaliterrae]|uniref:DNA-binding protein n=1 Tax=Streptomyces alkaliterrae TaxID=2213162 RepID=A0A5P0YLF7_9ACTN|nr:zinc ribbon domain-containing protein [Streptomyces alkaliterrae]MBB1251810.1 DNA-binding protein [Streptomyces alkaliterrae]MBB1257822.1 DNA-binding protein [Streptomyces alkaliterrae]MQS01183.1 DNA-binding protein [Streptomyces alkaliterrae]
MAAKNVRAYVNDRQVRCAFCGHERFNERSIKLNTAGMSFFDLDWANKSATGLICADCGYVQMFLEPRIQYAE